MTIASILFGFLIASIFGCAFHFWRGGGLKWLIGFNIFAWIGFWIGHLVGKLSDFRFVLVGPIYLGAAIMGTLVILFLGYWLSMASQDTTKRRG